MVKEALEDEKALQMLCEELDRRGYSKALDTVERFRFDLWNYKAFPKSHWKRIRTTNGTNK